MEASVGNQCQIGESVQRAHSTVTTITNHPSCAAIEGLEQWELFDDANGEFMFSSADHNLLESSMREHVIPPQCELATVNHNTEQSVNSSMTLSPATPRFVDNPTMQSFYQYHLDCSYDFNSLYDPNLGLVDAGQPLQEHLSNCAQPELDHYNHIDYALSCCETPPCTDPDCNDIIFCNEQTACCYLEQCLRGDPCDSDECAIDAANSPPCYDAHCEEPPCTEAHATAVCHPEGHMDGNYVQPPCSCVDPACLSKDHEHQHAHGIDDFVRPQKRRKVSSFLPSELSHIYDSKLDTTRSTFNLTSHYNDAFHGSHVTDRTVTPETSSAPHINHFTKHSALPTMAKLGKQDTPIIKGGHQERVCRWLEDGIMCGAVLPDGEALQQHVETEHITNPAKQSEYYCLWEGCYKGRIAEVAGVKMEESDNAESALASDCNSICDLNVRRGFATRPKLKRHVQVHTSYKPYKCEICGSQMKTRDALVKHQRTHTGEKPYSCPQCDKRFATTTELKTHSTVHTGDKPHVCPECGERFADSSNLSKHKKTHFSGMFKCEDCGVQMKRWDQMKRHIEQRGHMCHLLKDGEANKAYKARMMEDFKPERVETRTEQKKRRDEDRDRSFSVFSERSIENQEMGLRKVLRLPVS